MNEFHKIKPLGEHLKAKAVTRVAQAVHGKRLDPEAAANGVLLISIAFFLAQYAIAWFICFRKWRGQKRNRACSACISFAHGLVSATLAARELYSTANWLLDGPNSATQNRIMEWSIAYFAVDIIHYLAFVPQDQLFIGHHLATLSYMISCRYFVHYGAKSVMYLIAAGELTTPMQAIWTLALLRRDDSRLADRTFTILSPIFTISFTAVRGVLGPYLLWELIKFYTWGHTGLVIPKWLALCWILKVSAGVIGSVIWGFKLWKGLLKFYIQRMHIFRNYGRGRRQD